MDNRKTITLVVLLTFVGGCGTAADLAGETSTSTSTSTTTTTTTLDYSCQTKTQEISALSGNVINVSVAPQSDNVIVDGSTTTLRQVIRDANEGDIILLADGTYTFAESTGRSEYTGMYFTTNNLTMRSSSGNPEAVVLDAEYKDLGGETSPITINASNIVLANFTVKRAIFHLIHFSGGSDNSVIHNVKLIDGGQQFLKASSGDESIDNVSVTCSDFTMTSSGRDNIWGYGGQYTHCYTGGIDTHNATNWTISNNSFTGIYCNADGVLRPAHGEKVTPAYTGGLAEYAIHMWDSQQGTGHDIEHNKIINCARGIGVGNKSEVYGAYIAHNMIFSEHAGSNEHDVVISVMRGHGSRILNNTIYLSSPAAYSNSIEYRYSSTSETEIRNNLTNMPISSRDGANATLSNNLENAESSWFVDPFLGDLRLSSCSIGLVEDQGASITGLDGDERDSSMDIGDDECR